MASVGVLASVCLDHGEQARTGKGTVGPGELSSRFECILEVGRGHGSVVVGGRPRS